MIYLDKKTIVFDLDETLVRAQIRPFEDGVYNEKIALIERGANYARNPQKYV